MDARSAARLAAVQAIYEQDVNPETDSDVKFLGSTFDQKRINKNIFAAVLDAYDDNQEVIDETITNNLSEGWSFERLAGILKAILRAGITELQFSDTPKNVIISEYVAIADSFVDEREVRFVNALLDKV